MQVAPSILISDYTRLGDVVRFVEEVGSDMLHLDVMDGVFVPNLSFGPPIIEALRPLTALPFDVHLMMQYPDRLIGTFARAGADIINFHVECDSPIAETIAKIRKHGKKAALTIKPNTPAEAVFPYLDQLSMVLVMTVEPGFGGQAFMEEMLQKVTAIKNEADRQGVSVLVQVDGGVGEQTAALCAKAGVDVAVVGSALFKAEDPHGLVARIHSL